MNTFLSIRSLFQILLLLGLLPSFSSLLAQDVAFVSRFEHQTESPVAYPDYFQNQTWTKAMMKDVGNWVKERFNVSQVDYKRRDPINFIPGIRTPGQLRSFNNTGYDLVISIVSRLETGLDTRGLEAREARMSIYVEIWNRNQKRVFKNRVKTQFIIIPYQDSLAEIMISEKDFQDFYLQSLKAAFLAGDKPGPQAYRQPPPQQYRDFVGNARKETLRRLDRVTFVLEGDSQTRISMNLEAPYKQDKRYGRKAKLFLPFPSKNRTLEGVLHTNYAYGIQMQASEAQGAIGDFFIQNRPEVREIKASLKDDKFVLTRSFSSQVVKIEYRSELIAILEPKKGFSAKKEAYFIYFKKKLESSLINDIFTLLLGEILGEAVEKYYRIETGSNG